VSVDDPEGHHAEARLAPDPLPFRAAMGEFPTGVAILGAVSDSELPLAVTVNSVVSISLRPPIVGVFLGNQLRARLAVVERAFFGLSVLRAGQESIARSFGRPGRTRNQALTDDPDWALVSGVPFVRSSLTWLWCTVRDLIEIGDHTLVTAFPELLEAPDRPVSSDASASVQPLVFYRSGFSTVARCGAGHGLAADR
jgi:flavin reductase (DIM6/NTAB) family NADH-FMN oxidoreductase RutF